MSELASPGAFGTLTEPATLTLQRVLPGPIERVWAYLTDGELRRQWLAAGPMAMQLGAPVELVWRNDELTDPPGQRPDGFGAEHHMQCEITELDPPRKLAISWGGTGGVSFQLEPRGDQVLLTLVHRRIEQRAARLNISAGWHAHLDLLVARLSGTVPPPFWDGFKRLKDEYERRLPA